MHQILALREYRDKKDNKVKKACRWFEKGFRAPSIEEILHNPLTFIENVEESEKINVYFTVAHCFEEQGRKLKLQQYIPFDIDGLEIQTMPDSADPNPIYLEQVARITCKALGVAYEETGIIFSGNGLQFFIKTSHHITSEVYFDQTRHHYKAMCDLITLALMKNGLKGQADVSVWSKSRLMRYPETINKKPDKPTRKAFVVQKNMVEVDFNIVDKSGLPVVEKDTDYIDPTILKNFPEPDTETILGEKGCSFLKWCEAKPNDVIEPQWYAMLSVVPRLKDGRKLAHTMSEGHGAYSYHETDVKIDQALQSSGPRTCTNIANLWDGCSKCPNFEKVKSPILIRSEKFIKTRATGFYNVVVDGQGNPKRGQPDYEGLRQHFIETHGDYKILPDAGYIYLWNGKYYEMMEKAFVQSFMQDQMDPKPCSHHLNEFWNRFRIHKDSLISPDWMSESTTNKVNFQNGVFLVEQGILEPHNKEYGFTGILGCDYNENAKSPIFDKFMEQVTCGDKEIEDLILEFFGYSVISGDLVHQKALFLYGTGSNGKSTLLDVFKALLNKNYSSVKLKELNEDQKRFLCYGKLVNIAEEANGRAFTNTDTLKDFITGGDLTAKKVYSAPVSFKNTTRLIVTMNSLPDETELTYGFFRRLLMVPFNARFSRDAGNMDKFILKKLKNELSGIFNRVMDGYKRLEKQGDFTISKASERLLNTYRDIMDVDGDWFESRIVSVDDPEKSSPIDDIYSDYREFMVNEGLSLNKIPTKKKMLLTLKEKLNGKYDPNYRPGTRGGDRKRRLKGYMVVPTENKVEY